MESKDSEIEPLQKVLYNRTLENLFWRYLVKNYQTNWGLK